MSLTLSTKVLLATTCDALESERRHVQESSLDRDYKVDVDQLGEGDLNDVRKTAAQLKDTKTVRAVEAILAARKGRFNKPIPNFKAFQGILLAFLKQDVIDGWIYVKGDDGKLYPELVTGISYEAANKQLGGDGFPLGANPNRKLQLLSEPRKSKRGNRLAILRALLHPAGCRQPAYLGCARKCRDL